MSILICPNCKGNLKESENSFKCPNGHSFDRAKQGYVNLLLTQKSSQKRHGDDRLMLDARTEFLSGNYYKPLLEALCKNVFQNMPDNGVLLDCGCGEGYYTDGLYKFFEQNDKSCKIYGSDISKDAVIATARRNKNISLFVSSVAQLPVKSNSVDIITSLFAPHCDVEFYRVLKKNGVLIRVIPLEDHLFELKEAVYDAPCKNVPDMPSLFGFSLARQENIKYKFFVPKEQLKNLFMMTPYYYKTSLKDQQKLEKVDNLSIIAEFSILIYEKE